MTDEQMDKLIEAMKSAIERMGTTPSVMTAEQVSNMLGCTSKQVEAYARKGVLPGVRMGSKSAWVFPPVALARALDRLAEEEAAKRSAPPAPAPRAVHMRVRSILPSLAEIEAMAIPVQRKVRG
jgi:Helix-turn-helix domain